MQTAFINNVPLSKLPEITGLLKLAPGFLYAENLHDKNSGDETGVIFCRFQDTGFQAFKKFLETHPDWISSIVIQEGEKL